MVSADNLKRQCQTEPKVSPGLAYLANGKIVALWTMDGGIVRIKCVEGNTCFNRNESTDVAWNYGMRYLAVMAIYTEAQFLRLFC